MVTKMNNQYQQPNQQMPPPYVPPQKPRIDPAEIKKQKTDAVNALGDKVSAALKADPILAFFEKNAEVFSYIATGVCALLSIALMSAGRFWIPFGIVSVIFGFFALSKKKLLPLAAAMSTVSLFSLVCFIHSIVSIVQTVKYNFFGAALGGAVLGMFFSLLELAAVGFLTYIVWTYFMAVQPPKPASAQQPYYGQSQQPTQYGQPMQQTPVQPPQSPKAPQSPQSPQHAQPAQPVTASSEPVLDPIVSAAASPAPTPVSAPSPVNAPAAVAVADPVPSEKPNVTHKFCSACGAENGIEAAFCKQCGTKF